MLTDREQSQNGPDQRECAWEKPLRVKLAFLCMAAVAGKEGDLRFLTDDIIHFARNLSGAEAAPASAGGRQ